MLSINFEYPVTREMINLFLIADGDEWIGSDKKLSEEDAIVSWEALMVKRQEACWPTLVLRINERPIGFALSVNCTAGRAVLAKLPADNNYWKLGNFFIHPNFRGKGYGTMAAEYFLRQKKKMVYFVAYGNHISERIPLKIGLVHTHDFWLSDLHGKSWIDTTPPPAYLDDCTKFKCYMN